MLSVDDVQAARDRVAETTRQTPLEYSHTFSAMTGAEVHLKLELFQRTGSFKLRGATNRIATLSADQRENGVVTASAGHPHRRRLDYRDARTRPHLEGEGHTELRW